MTTTIKRLVAYHISRLQDKDAQVRLKAIHELELLGDADALASLEKVFAEDDNHEVRKAAQEAGKAIFRKNLKADR